MTAPPDAVLLIAFGGPERPEDVRPFLANVTRGRPIPSARIEDVAHHYAKIGGRSPLAGLTFRQAEALRARLSADGLALPVYVGMRSWHPYLHETLARMAGDGVRHALGVILSAQQTEASWSRYQATVAEACDPFLWPFVAKPPRWTSVCHSSLPVCRSKQSTDCVSVL